MRNLFFFILYLITIAQGFSQEGTVWLNPNKGQWHPNIQYQIDLAGGKMYVEKDGFTYHFYEIPDRHAKKNEIDSTLKQHVVRSKFIQSNWSGKLTHQDSSTFYRNYFLGNDKSQWASKVKSFSDVCFTSLYTGIDLQMSGKNGGFKYSFIVQPEANPNLIQWEIIGADNVKINANGEINIHTTLGIITESKPIAWTINNGKKTPVEIRYRLKHNVISFELTKTYQQADTLIIDPSLIFSTFTGSTTDNWGMTATPGPNGELYSGGISFGVGYPVTSGAFDMTYNSGNASFNLPGFDVSISKFNADGSQLLYSTYLGGGGNELPESMICNSLGELYVLGITSSPNFPVGATPYQSIFAGGNSETQNSLKFLGSDLFITNFSEDGTQLLASTYVGGNQNDGMNLSVLSFNYGDQFRGEINLYNNRVFVSSHTKSTDFPVTNASSLNGGQDLIVFEISDDLSSLIWSSYYGGLADESGNSLAINSVGEIYITGGTTSTNFNLPGQQTTYNGGRDGYILKISSVDGAVLGGTYLGSNEYDQCYFVRTDIDDKVYVFGQTDAPWPITPGKYGNPNSGQFIRKYDADLTTIEWSTAIGAGSGFAEISPTAFLISDCYDIFITGWGGEVNVNGSQATHSSSNGFPVTSNAYQLTTNGSNFYLGILSQDAESLIYGTYLGGFNSSHNHVDGGTSRFDKSGAVYHAVCAACGGNLNGFISTPGAWSETNNSPNCNLAAFKFQLGLPYSLSANSWVCEGGTIQLNASGGINYSWSPASSLNNPNIANPIASPTETTVYYVNMDFNEGCSIEDSVIVEVIQAPGVSILSNTEVCKNDTIQITASGGQSYEWSPQPIIGDPTAQTIRVSPDQDMYYYVDVSNACFTTRDSIFVDVLPLPEIYLADDTTICEGADVLLVPDGDMNPIWESDPNLIINSDGTALAHPTEEHYFYVNGIGLNSCKNRDSVFVQFYDIPAITITPDTTVCDGTSAILNASGGQSYAWQPANSLENENTANPTATPTQATDYTVTITYGNACETTADVFVDIIHLPVPEAPDSIYACYGETETIVISGATSYLWTPSSNLSSNSNDTVELTVQNDITYNIAFTNVCGTVYDSIYINAIFPEVKAFKDTIICPGESTQLTAIGAINYHWQPGSGLSNTQASSVIATPTQSTQYIVTGTDQYGCQISDTVFVELYPQPYIIASPDQYLFEGESTQINATTTSVGAVYWSPSEYLSCVVCSETVASPPHNFKYIVTIEDTNGCRNTDEVWILFEPLIYIPNTFTPQTDGINDLFKVKGGNIRDFELHIFNRWGELIFTSNDINLGWDGTYQGKICQDGTYTWKLSYKDLEDNEHKQVGHVNLIR